MPYRELVIMTRPAGFGKKAGKRALTGAAVGGGLAGPPGAAVGSAAGALSDATPGHAMLAISTAGVGEEAWGFYGNGKVRKEFKVGGLERYATSSVIPITDQQYAAIKAQIHQWEGGKKKYHLFNQNCIDFVITVVQKAGINVPRKELWPSGFGQAVMKMHGEGWGQCLARDAGVEPESLYCEAP